MAGKADMSSKALEAAAAAAAVAAAMGPGEDEDVDSASAVEEQSAAALFRADLEEALKVVADEQAEVAGDVAAIDAQMAEAANSGVAWTEASDESLGGGDGAGEGHGGGVYTIKELSMQHARTSAKACTLGRERERLERALGELISMVGTGVWCSPRHMMPCNSRNEGSKCVS
jgi:hypothetical protein